jgi:uncharacterized protein (DUF1684 family)
MKIGTGHRWRSLVAVALLTAGAASPLRAEDSSSLPADLAQWRQSRVAALTSDTGFLSLVGLYWPEPGRNSFGRSDRSTFVLDHPAMPAHAGDFVLTGSRLKFIAARRSGVLHDGQPVAQVTLAADTSGRPTILSVGTLQFFAIERDGKLGIRVRDTYSPRRRDFPGIDYFDADASWRIEARFEPYVPARRIRIVNVLGMELDMPSPGAILFDRDGQTWRLDMIEEDTAAPTLFVMFADGTTGRETYGAGRFLDVPRPVDGRVTVDFNRAYNPPCAFNTLATCPLPPPQNKLELRIPAGEKTFPPAGSSAAH